MKRFHQIDSIKFEFCDEIPRVRCEGKGRVEKGGREINEVGRDGSKKWTRKGVMGKRSLRFRQVSQFLKPPRTLELSSTMVPMSFVLAY